MILRNEQACLGQLNLIEINKIIPVNCYMQGLSIGYGRKREFDKQWESKRFSLFKPMVCEPNLYINYTTINLASPIKYEPEHPVKLEELVEQIEYFCERAREHDPLVEQRMVIGDAEILEIPEDFIGEDKWKHGRENDKLLDGVFGFIGYFKKQMKVLGLKDGPINIITPGHTLMPADLVKVEMIKTKPARGNLLKKPELNRYDVVKIFEAEEINKNTNIEWIGEMFPKLLASKILTIRIMEGRKDLGPMRFIAESCELSDIDNFLKSLGEAN